MNKTLGWLKNHRIAVLKGGWSRERPISLLTGAAVEKAFAVMGVKTLNIDVRRDIASRLAKIRPDFCFIALHGTFGEDGQVQSLLERMKIRYTGSGPLGSSLAMDKNISKRLFIDHNVPTAPWILLEKHQSVDPVYAWLKKSALFVKPVDQGSAIGATRVDRPAQLPRALKASFRVSGRAMIEKFIPGREVTVGILGNKPLPVVEIIPKHAFYDFHSKYAAGGSRHVAPAKLPAALSKKIQRVAVEAFKALRCRIYGRVDLLIAKNNDLFVLEVNTIPGMTATSLLPDAARVAGLSFNDLVLRICALSLADRGKQ